MSWQGAASWLWHAYVRAGLDPVVHTAGGSATHPFAEGATFHAEHIQVLALELPGPIPEAVRRHLQRAPERWTVDGGDEGAVSFATHFAGPASGGPPAYITLQPSAAPPPEPPGSVPGADPGSPLAAPALATVGGGEAEEAMLDARPATDDLTGRSSGPPDGNHPRGPGTRRSAQPSRPTAPLRKSDFAGVVDFARLAYARELRVTCADRSVWRVWPLNVWPMSPAYADFVEVLRAEREDPGDEVVSIGPTLLIPCPEVVAVDILVAGAEPNRDGHPDVGVCAVALDELYTEGVPDLYTEGVSDHER